MFHITCKSKRGLFLKFQKQYNSQLLHSPTFSFENQTRFFDSLLVLNFLVLFLILVQLELYLPEESEILL